MQLRAILAPSARLFWRFACTSFVDCCPEPRKLQAFNNITSTSAFGIPTTTAKILLAISVCMLYNPPLVALAMRSMHASHCIACRVKKEVVGFQDILL